VAGLPITEVPAAGTPASLFAIFLSGDGGWADLDRDVGIELANAGIPVVGINSRAYLTSGRRDPDVLGADIARVARAYQTKWRLTSFALIGYSRGAVLAPFAATRLPADLKTQLRLVALLGLQERAGFTFHLTDVVSKHSPKDGLPVLPELEQLRGTNMLCVYGKDEEESLCRSVDSTLVRPFAREGAHHFDRDYPALARIILSAVR
jgi:type IV secretory pathway VirJ component